jgi:hypothetical protein
MRFHPVLGLALLSSFAVCGDASAMGSKNPGGDSAAVIESAIRNAPVFKSGIGKRTFVFFVNGDADHFVTDTADSTKPELSRVDAADVRKIEQLALSCSDCNVVVLHDQRGTDKWYTKDDPWATFLRVYSRGRKYYEKSVSEINMAEPRVLSELLKYSERAFPGAGLYLVYRGHSFIPRYESGKPETGLAPFDYSNPQSPYGVREFAESLRRAGLSQKLNAVVMAACTMADAQFADAIAPFARTLISPQLEVLETLSTGFGYRYLKELDAVEFRSEAVASIATLLLEPIRITKNDDDALMEYPVSVIDLEAFGRVSVFLRELVSTSGVPEAEVREKALLVKSLSARTVEGLRKKGKTEGQIARLIDALRQPSRNPDALDVKLLLELLKARSSDSASVLQRIAEIEALLAAAVRVRDRPEFSRTNGLTFQLKE